MRMMSLLTVLAFSCAGPEGLQGPSGPPGAMGAMGTMGLPGTGLAERDGTRIKVRYLTTQDGLRHAIGYTDTKSGTPCLWQTYLDGKLRCLPSGPALASIYFADAACTIPIGLRGIDPGACTPDSPTHARRQDGCIGSLHRITGTLTPIPTMVYYGMPGRCAGSTTPPRDSVAYRVDAAEMRPDDFVQAEVRDE